MLHKMAACLHTYNIMLYTGSLLSIFSSMIHAYFWLFSDTLGKKALFKMFCGSIWFLTLSFTSHAFTQPTSITTMVQREGAL